MENRSQNNTRRQFLVGSAGALGGLAAAGAFANPALAGEHGNGNGMGDDDPGMPQNEFEDDIEILNFARTLEFLEARFYRQGLDNIGEDGIRNVKALSKNEGLQDRAFGELRRIQEHEELHADILGEVVQDLGGEPVPEPEFDFGEAVQSAPTFLATAAQLEDIGVSAYAGAAPHIENEDLVPPALGIHSVEARHASFARTLNEQTGFPDVIDQPRSRSEVLALASPFIVGMDAGDEHQNGDQDDTHDNDR